MPEVLSLPLILPATAPLPVRDGLRPYQREGVNAWKRDLETKRAALGVMFTGGGKTRTAGTLAHERGGRSLWLAMRDFLLDQAAAALGQITGEWIGREQAGWTSRGERIVVGSVQTLKGKRLADWPKDTFSTIFFDEAHHAVAPGPRAIFDHFETAKIVGLTATPYRLDDIGLNNVFGETPSFVYDIQFGMSEGYFCPVIPREVDIESIDVSGIKSVGSENGNDLKLTDLEKKIIENTAPIARASWEESEHGGLPTIVYTPGVASAKSACEAINELAGKEVAVYVEADTPGKRRAYILENFGKSIRFIVNCQIYTEGLDVPLARCIVIARLTESLSLYQQMAGRGGRPAEGIGQLETKEERHAAIAASSKPWFKLVDISGHAGKHTLIGAVDALCGKSVPESVAKAAREIIRSSPGVKLDEAVRIAKAEAARKEREELEAAARKIAQISAVVEIKTSKKTFDAFAKLGADEIGNSGVAPGWLQQQPTPEQLLWLKENRLPTDISRGACAKLERQAREWKKKGLASFKQRRILARADLPVDVPGRVATRLVQALIDSNWNAKRAKLYTDRILSEGRTVGEEG